MKAKSPTPPLFAERIIPRGMRPIGLAVLAVAMTGSIGCAAPQPQGAHRTRAPADETVVQPDPGAIGVAAADRRAQWSYDAPRGQIRTAADGAGEAARATLELTTPEEPGVNVLVSAIGFVGAPVTAAIGAIRASGSKLTENELADSEAGLGRSMAAMSQQDYLRDRVLDAAKIAGSRRFVAWAAASAPAGQSNDRKLAPAPPVGTILETRVEDIRLQRQGARDASFALVIKARARLLRAATGEVISDEPFEYRSGRDLFLDWALNNGEPFRQCADTGYRELAARIVEHVSQVTGEAPILIGAGAPKPSVHLQRPQARLASHRLAPDGPAHVQLVSQVSATPGTIFVYPASPAHSIGMQKPLTRDEAVSDAIAGVQWSLDGLDVHPNFFVSLTAIAAAVPLSICHQTIALLGGTSEKKYRAAESRMAAAATGSQPAADVAQAIALQLGRSCSETVVLLDKPRDGAGQFAAVEPTSARPVLASWGENGAAMPRSGDKALKIEVLRAGLTGNGSANGSLAMRLEARATLLNAKDGREIYSCPMQYQGRAHKFTTWAAKDAKLFREELQRCYGELGDTVVSQMMARGLVAPGENLNMFADGR